MCSPSPPSFPPFQGEPKWYQFKKICAGHIEYWPERFPAECAPAVRARASSTLTSPPPSARSIVCALLRKEESHRLGLLAGGVQEIKAHPFYAELNWAALAALELPPPFRPSDSEWRQATAAPADSKRLVQELERSMVEDRPLSEAQEVVFAGYRG